MRKWTTAATVALLALGAACQATAAPPSETQVRELLDAMHMDRMFDQMNAQMGGFMAQAVPCVPASRWQGFIDASGKQELLSQMIPIYQRHFTAEDVSGLLKFYRSPLGQKVITQMPQTMAEGMKAGQAWGRNRGEAMVRQLQQEGVLGADGRCPAAPARAPAAPVPKPGG